MERGRVFLVGAGPGDASLITVKGLEAIKRADVILYDRLANPKLLEFAPVDCELVYCGKLPDRHILRQDGINALLVSKALEGKMVVRLKGGDPGVFGRVGEEAAALAEHEIAFELVPGISSGIAAPLYAGIPVTHREYAESFAVVTAHDKSENGRPLLDWAGLASGVDTIAFYMGVANLPFICENLISHGKSATTPVILIQWGTFGRQKTLQGTLADIAEKVKVAKFSNPSIILVGEVISLREKLRWFEKKPLYGKQIILARTTTEPSELAKELMEQGADVIEFPKWKKSAVEGDERVWNRLDCYDSILFASPESVPEFFNLLVQKEIDIRSIHAKFLAGSVKTKRALNERGFLAEIVGQLSAPDGVLVVGDDAITTPDARYAGFDALITSKKEIDTQFHSIFKRMLEEAEPNTMIFPCAASVSSFMDEVTACGIDVFDLLGQLEVVCMGEQTSSAAKEAGVGRMNMPVKATKGGIIECLQNRVMV